MAFRSGLFTSTTGTVDGNGMFIGNKAITSAQRALELYHIYGDGISLKPSSAFYVAPKSGLIVTVSAGWGLMSGYPFEETEDVDIAMTSSTSEQTLYIGVRLNVAAGEYTGNHVAARTTFVAATDRVFAIIVIPANAVTLTTGMITDTRTNPTYCGTIDSQRLALTDIYNEYRDALIVLANTGIPLHKTSHYTGGSDAIAATDIGAIPSISVPSNIIINGGFNINQRVKSGTVTLAAGVYGHDRWKAGASGCTYTFATSENVTTLTISAGSLIQVTEGISLKSGTVCLSWAGTAQGKIGAGSYAASGVTGSAIGGTNLNVEFGTGTLANVQLNYGAVALPFVLPKFADELQRCQRYYEKSYDYATAPGAVGSANGIWFTGVQGIAVANGSRWIIGQHPRFTVRKRSSAAITLYTYSGAVGKWEITGSVERATSASAGETGFYITNNTGGTVTPTAGEAYGHWVADAEI